jgi:outer membrane receptor protein involved in Fe transport
LTTRVVACLALAFAAASGGPAIAGSPSDKCDVHVADIGLADAVNRLARQCNAQLLFSFDLARTEGLHPVNGRYSVPEALRKMLQDTGLSGQQAASGIITITRPTQTREADMTKISKGGLLSGVSGLVLGLVGAMDAQAADVAPPTTVQEVIVTSGKRAQSVQDVPASVTALTGRVLEDRGAVGFSDLARSAPGVTLNTENQAFSKFSIRGIQTTTSSSSNGEQKTVAVYLDDLPITSFSVVTPNIALYDMDRVEVLRGPQGTLFGSGSLSGAVREITHKPDLGRYEASLGVDIGRTGSSSNRARVDGMVNIPLIDHELAVRIVAYARDEDGYTNNTGSKLKNGDTKTESGGRVSVKWTPNDRLTVSAMQIFDALHLDDLPDINPALGTNTRSTFTPSVVNSRITSSNVGVSYDFGSAKLSSSTTYAVASNWWNLALDNLPLPFPYALHEQISSNSLIQEVNLASQRSDKVTWVVGAFGMQQKSTEIDSTYTTVAAMNLFGITGLSQQQSPGYDLTKGDRYKTNSEYAAYANMSWEFMPKWRVELGVRYSQLEFKDRAPNFNYNNVTPVIFGILGFAPKAVTTVFQPASEASTGTQSKLTKKISLTWQPEHSLNFYVTAADGFRRPHPNNQPGKSQIDPTDPTVIPATSQGDSLWNYEIGAKTVLLDGRLLANVAAYYIPWTNMQVDLQRSSDALPYTGNIGKAVSQGVEAEFEARPTDDLTLGLNLTFADAKVTELTALDALVSGALKGSALSTPKFEAGAQAEYVWRLNDGGRITARIDAAHRGSMPNGFPNINGIGTPNPVYKMLKAYTVSNASVRWTRGGLKAEVYAENLFDDHTYVFVNPTTYSLNTYETLRPRTVGVRLGWKY